ncbi:hypothetical protein J3B02_003618 [Coemansia erecta]|nr:hypothetical protein J3B02_003618 [Coemansia erecta]
MSNKDLKCRIASPDDSPSSELLLSKFLSICKDWRSIALPHVCKTLIIDASSRKRPIKLYYPLWSQIDMPPVESFDKVKSVSIDTGLLNLINGDLLSNLQQGHKHMRLEKATSLDFNIIVLGRNERVPEQINAEDRDNVSMLAKHIKEIMPEIKSIGLSFFHISPQITSFIGLFVSKLEAFFGIQVSTTICPSRISILDSSTSINVPGRLTSVKCWWDGYYYLSKELILQNAQSLKYLEIIFSHALDLNDLIEDYQGNPVVYPNMEKLRLVNSMLEDADYEPNTPSTEVQFPKLRYLLIDIKYPFIDDILFRGNHQTLMFLYIKPCLGVMDILRKYQVFESHPFSSLFHIMVSPPVEQLERELWPEERFELALNSSNIVQTLILEHMKKASCLINALPDYKHNLKNLYILSMRLTPVTLENIFLIAKHLPALHEFHSVYQGLGKQLEIIQEEELPEYVSKNFSIFSKLAIWEIWNEDSEMLDSLAMACLLLSIACQDFANLAYAEPSFEKMYLFNQALQSLGKSPAFADYSDNMSRILFKEL